MSQSSAILPSTHNFSKAPEAALEPKSTDSVEVHCAKLQKKNMQAETCQKEKEEKLDQLEKEEAASKVEVACKEEEKLTVETAEIQTSMLEYYRELVVVLWAIQNKKPPKPYVGWVKKSSTSFCHWIGHVPFSIPFSIPLEGSEYSSGLVRRLEEKIVRLRI
ncbi:hypothetical protein F5I97DRAFT_1829562 [Phlebopus sp. FC_14]|nr:hypothetical protein F5I97DRAFT_1829562 [Phlebopus sp. FC_14]